MATEPVTLERLCAAALTELEGVARGAAPARYRATVRRIVALVPELTPERVGAALWGALTTGMANGRAPHLHAAERLVTLNTRARLTKITNTNQVTLNMRARFTNTNQGDTTP